MKANHLPKIIILSLLAAITPVQGIDLQPTPQNYGIIDSGHIGGLRNQAKPDFVWIDISSTGAQVVGPGVGISSNTSTLGDSVTLPQPFPFYGTDYTQIVPCSSGYLSFDPNEEGLDNGPLCAPATPNKGEGARIFPLHANLEVITGIYYQYFEISPHPHRRCGVAVFTWDKVTHDTNGATMSFQTLLFDNGDILNQYGVSNDNSTLPNATIAIQNETFNEGLNFDCGTNMAIPIATAVLFRAPEAVIDDGVQLATAIASVRNGGKIRFDVDGDTQTPNLMNIGSIGPISISKSVCIDFTLELTNTDSFRRREIDCEGQVRAFDITSNGRLLIVGAGIKNAHSSTSGGAISVLGELKICDADIHHNHSDQNGGAIRVGGSGKAWLSRCNFWRNTAGVSGGAAYTDSNGFRIDNCSFFRNSAQTGGAVHLDVTLTDSVITNSTFTGNTASVRGSAIHLLECNATLRHNTIAENGDSRTVSAGAIYSSEGSLTIGHNILGPNNDPSYGEAFGQLTSLGHNLDSDDDYGLDAGLNTMPGDQFSADSHLSPLGLHGDRIFTMHPLVNSPALDLGKAGISDAPATDPRGLPRIADSDYFAGKRIDIGAVECGPIVTVNTTIDEAVSSNQTADTGLREAIEMAEEGGRIAFDPSLSGQEIRVDFSESGTGETIAPRLVVIQTSLFIDASNLAAAPTILQSGISSAPRLFYNKRTLASGDLDYDEYDFASLSLHSLKLQVNPTNPRGAGLKGHIFNVYNSAGLPMGFQADWVNLHDSSSASTETIYGCYENASVSVYTHLDADNIPVNYQILPPMAEFKNTAHADLTDIDAVEHTHVHGALLEDTAEINPDTGRIVYEYCQGGHIGSRLGSPVETVHVRHCSTIGGTGSMTFSGQYVEVDSCVIANNDFTGTVFSVFAADGKITNTTIANNFSTQFAQSSCNGFGNHFFGGNATVYVTSVTLENCTIYNNRMTVWNSPATGCVDPDFRGFTAGIRGDSFTLKNSIIARNRLFDQRSFSDPTFSIDNLLETSSIFSISSLGNNLLDTDELTLHGAAIASDLENTDPRLFPLRNNGGLYPTHMPMAASPAIDTITTPTDLTLDGRGYLRVVQGNPQIPGSRLDIGAVEATLPVEVAISQDSLNSGDISLRDALAIKNPAPYESYPTRIIFEPSEFLNTNIVLGSTLATDSATTIDATSVPSGVTLEGGDSFRLFLINADHRVDMAALSFTKGKSTAFGGALLNLGDLYITESAFYENEASSDGGAIRNGRSSSVLLAENCTFSDNTAGGEGGAVSDRVPNPATTHTEFRHCTFADNQSGSGSGALYLGAQTATLYANLFSNNGTNIGIRAGTVVTSEGYNLYDDGGFAGNSGVDILNTTAMISGIADNGGFAFTNALQTGSPAIDAGPDLYAATGPTTLHDGRGFLRQLLFPGGKLDIGAFETGSQDNDGDLIPDDWELANALDPNDPNDATADNDWDGVTNLDEYRNGTLPWDNYSKNGNFKPVPTFVQNEDGFWDYEWSSTSLTPPTQTSVYYTYQVEVSTDLVTWLPYGDSITGGNIDYLLTIKPDGPQDTEQYFRLHFRVNLSGQDLSGQNFSNVDLSGADLSGADLSGADFSNADLSGADLTGTNITGTNMTGVNFTGATGLEFAAFPGDGVDPVNGSLPGIIPVLGSGDFSTDHPDAVDEVVSHTTIGVTFVPGTSIASANTFLSTHSLTVIGSIPSPDGSVAIFCLRTPAINHAEFAPLFTQIEADPVIQHAAPNLVLETNALPDINQAGSSNWTQWSPSMTASPGNWGMKYIRAPQLWNFNEAIQKRIDQGESNRRINVGVLDGGIHTANVELASLSITQVNSPKTTPTTNSTSHGTHVTGIIAGPHTNGGVDGVTPFANIYFSYGSADLSGFPPSITTDAFGNSGVLILGLYSSPIKAANMSMGYSVKIWTNSTIITWVQQWGEMFASVWSVLPNRPVLACSAGNRPIQAQNNSVVAYAGLAKNISGIYATQNLTNAATLASSSGLNGTIAAPGTQIYSSSFPGSYQLKSGTSMASPHVAGSVAYLFSLKPSLTIAQIDTLLANNPNARGPANGLDTWAAAMDIDAVAGGDEILSMWCDFDDGTKDGNQREFYTVDTAADMPTEDPTVPSFMEFENDDVDGDGGIGDGRIDMSDFRRFRDWTSICRSELDGDGLPSGLDGFLNNPKNDPNRNGVTVDGYERYYPRNDLNGDGNGDWFETPKPVPGVIGGADKTDLQVLEELFADEFYDKTDLAGLKADSADIHFNFYWFVKWNLEHAEEITDVFVQVDDLTDPTNGKGPILLSLPNQLSPQGSDLVLTFRTGSNYKVSVWSYVGETTAVGEEYIFTFDEPLVDHWFSARAFDNFMPPN